MPLLKSNEKLESCRTCENAEKVAASNARIKRPNGFIAIKVKKFGRSPIVLTIESKVDPTARRPRLPKFPQDRAPYAGHAQFRVDHPHPGPLKLSIQAIRCLPFGPCRDKKIPIGDN